MNDHVIDFEDDKVTMSVPILALLGLVVAALSGVLGLIAHNTWVGIQHSNLIENVSRVAIENKKEMEVRQAPVYKIPDITEDVSEFAAKLDTTNQSIADIHVELRSYEGLIANNTKAMNDLTVWIKEQVALERLERNRAWDYMLERDSKKD